MNHDNFTEVTSEDAPQLIPAARRYLWALGYNTCLERTNAAELLECLIEAKLQIEYLHNKFKETGSGNSVINRINNAIKKATDESR